MKRKSIATASLALLLSSTHLYAADYYVAKNGNDADSGTQNSPWKSIAKANTSLSAGDTVYVRGGEYQDVIKPARSGTAGRMISYKAYPGEKPVITGSPGGTAIVLDNRSHVAVDGFSVDGKQPYPNSNLSGWISLNGGSYNVIQNSSFRYSKGWIAVHIAGGAHHNKLINNRMDHAGTWDKGGGKDYGNMINIDCASRNLLEGNHFTRAGHNMMLANGTNNVIINNIFDNKWGDNKGQRGGAVSGKGSCSAGRNLFEGNLVRNTLPAADEPVKTAQIKVEGSDHIVRRNFFVDGHNIAINTTARNEIPTSKGSRIYHNVMHDHGGPAWDVRFLASQAKANDDNEFKNNAISMSRNNAPRSSYDFDFVFSAPLKNNRVVNNAVSGNKGEARVALQGSTLSLSAAEDKYPGNFAKNIEAQPDFVVADPKLPADFRLRGNSALIDMGAHLTTATTSGSGIVVVVKDAGYFTDGFDITEGDSVQVGSNAPARVVAVDYANNKITVDRTLSWKAGDGVNLPFSGAAPDIGAHEHSDTVKLAAPSNLKIILQ